MPAKKKSASARKYGDSAKKNVESAMRRKKKGTLRSGKAGKGGKVKSRSKPLPSGSPKLVRRGQRYPVRRGVDPTFRAPEVRR